MPRRFGRWIAVLVASSVALLAPVPMLTPAAEALEPSTVPAIPVPYLNQRIDWTAAGLFNRFYYGLVERVAGQASTPSWKPGSKLRPTS